MNKITKDHMTQTPTKKEEHVVDCMSL